MYQRNLIVALCFGVCASPAFAAEDKIDYSFSVKAWNTGIDANISGGSTKTSKSNSPVIGLTARKGDYFVSASTLLDTGFVFKSGTANTATVARKDYDLSLGYRATPNLSVIAGHKSMTMTDHSVTTGHYVETHKGLYYGVAGFKLLTDQDFVYGNFWIAPKMSTSGTPVIDISDNVKVQNYEIGFGRALTPTTQFTVGFRNQQINLNNMSKQGRKETFTMEGVLVGLNVNF